MDIYAILLGIFLIGNMCWAAYRINKASKEGKAKSGDPKPIRPKTGFDPVPEEIECEFCDTGQHRFQDISDHYICNPCIDKILFYDIQKIAFADFHRQIGFLRSHLSNSLEVEMDLPTARLVIKEAIISLAMDMEEAQVGL